MWRRKREREIKKIKKKSYREETVEVEKEDLKRSVSFSSE